MAEQGGEGSQPRVLPDRVRQVLSRVQDMPTVSTVLSEVAEATSDPEVSARAVAEIIARDQALTMRLLRIVNSAFYGFRRRISTVHDAAVIMGTTALRAAVLGASVFESLKGSHDDEAYEALRQHSAETAEATRGLAVRYGYREPGEAHVAGLLHDVGKLVIRLQFPEEYAAIAAYQQSSHLPAVVAERKYLGATHTEIGGWVAEMWQLPAALRDALLCHHEPGAAGENSLLVALVHLGDVVAHTAAGMAGRPSASPPISSPGWAVLSARRSDIQQEEIHAFAEELVGVWDRVQALAYGLSAAAG